MYNLFVTVFAPDDLENYINNPPQRRTNIVIYDKAKDTSRSDSRGLLTLSFSNDVPFADNIPQSSDNGKKYSLKELDADYTAAVKAGDMKTAQKMVDEAAERAMPESILREGIAADTGDTETGKLIKMYHGSGAKNFYEFNLRDGALGKGAYFSSTMGKKWRVV